MITNISIQHKTYLKLLVAIISIYILAVSLGFYFADHEQYLLFALMVLIIIGNVYFGKYYANKLNQVLVISEDGIKLCVPEITNIFKIRNITVEANWKEIRQVILLDNKKGPIIIETCKGNFSFWHPLENKTNLQIVELLNNKIITG